ncbi:MAG: hypothetical protein ACRD0O_06560, partial [Acidimicrobiia bacterium]
MKRPTHPDQHGSRDRIAAFAEATEVYAASLEDPDLANVYWGKSLGLRQALTILNAEDGTRTPRGPQGQPATCKPRPADPDVLAAANRPVVSPAAASQG